VAGLFPDDDSLLRLLSAVMVEVSEDWETSRKYLTMGPARPTRLQAENLQKQAFTI
jgi:hypothetical protein